MVPRCLAVVLAASGTCVSCGLGESGDGLPLAAMVAGISDLLAFGGRIPWRRRSSIGLDKAGTCGQALVLCGA